MAKSLRSKKKKRLRTLRREIAEPFFDKKEAAKLAVQEAALAAPKLQFPSSNTVTNNNNNDNNNNNSNNSDVEMADSRATHGEGTESFLKPVGGVGKKWKKKSKLKKDKRHKRKNKRKHNF